jgi:hypothetical protein
MLETETDADLDVDASLPDPMVAQAHAGLHRVVDELHAAQLAGSTPTIM